MRVAFLATDYPTPAGPPACVFYRTLAEGLARSGAKVNVVAPVPRVPWRFERLAAKWLHYLTIPERYELGGVDVYRPRYWQLPRANYLGSRHGSFERCLLRGMEQPPDLVHAHSAYPSGFAAVRVASQWRVPVFLTLHGSDVNVYPNVNRRTRHLFSAAVKGATYVTAVSEALADRTEELTGRRPAVLPIGLDLRRYRELPGQAAARELLGLPSAARIVLFVGSLLEAKGVRGLVQALSRVRLPDTVGVFVGDGPLREVVASGVRTIAVGPVPNERVPLYLRAADVFALPSLSEGMPTVLVEAGAAGLPIVASEVGGVPELLAEERGLLIPSRDDDALVAALEAVLTDSVKASERAARLKEHVFQKYDVESTAAATMRIYDSLR